MTTKSAAFCGAVFLIATVSASAAGSRDDDSRRDKERLANHVLLISIDGMHALDFSNCAKGLPTIDGGQPYCPNMAELQESGLNYLSAQTARPSDSFPGLVGEITGGTTRSAGVFYDVSYDRSLAPPAMSPPGGVATAGPCPGQLGTVVEYDEAIDVDKTKVESGGINPLYLPRDPKNGCAPVYPHSYLRVNTIFEVIKAGGGYTAWSDKHPAYDIVNGPSGKGVDDLYTPEINSNVSPIATCPTLPDTSATVSDWTTSFQDIQCYDGLKVNAVLNWINGKSSAGKAVGKTPTIFGMNFQVVSVGQKLVEGGVRGGYEDALGTPTPQLLSEIQFADNSIGQMVSALKARGLYKKTYIIITAKHGQSPIDYGRLLRIPADDSSKKAPSDVISAALGASIIGNADEDDISLIWLTDQSKTADALSALEMNETTIGAAEIFQGNSLKLLFNDPAIDPRTPDIAVQPLQGVVYTGGKKKISEHGGFAPDDRNVMLLISNPNIESSNIVKNVETIQVAPTILQVLGLHPAALKAVQLEGTEVLPGLPSADF